MKTAGAKAAATAFLVRHTFADINYDGEGFITSNKQSHLPDIALTALAASSISFVAADVALTGGAAGSGDGSDSNNGGGNKHPPPPGAAGVAGALAAAAAEEAAKRAVLARAAAGNKHIIAFLFCVEFGIHYLLLRRIYVT